MVEVDPENAGEEGDGRRKREEQDDGPDNVFGDPPAGGGPEEEREERDEQNAQTVTDVHGAEEVAGFALVAEMADGAFFVHFGEAEINGMREYLSDAAAGAALVKNIVEGGKRAGLHKIGPV